MVQKEVQKPQEGSYLTCSRKSKKASVGEAEQAKGEIILSGVGQETDCEKPFLPCKDFGFYSSKMGGHWWIVNKAVT